MAKKKSVEELYKSIFSIRDKLQEALQLAADVSNQAQSFGGEISRVLTEQFNKFFIPEITKYVDDDNTPGAMLPLVSFLDSVPLAMTREEPSPQEIAPGPMNATAAANIAAPPTEPVAQSYAGQTSLPEEGKLEEAKWRQDFVPGQEDLYAIMTDLKGKVRVGWGSIKEAVIDALEMLSVEFKDPSEVALHIQQRYETNDVYAKTIVNTVVNYLSKLPLKPKATLIKKSIKENLPISDEASSDFEEMGSREPLMQEFLSIEGAISNIPDNYERQVADDNFKTMIDTYVNQYNDSFPEMRAEVDNVETWSDELLSEIVSAGNELIGQVVPLKEAAPESLDLNKSKGETYGVYRKNTGGSTLGDQSNMEDFLVATKNTKEEADALVKELEATILPSEKEFLGIEYFAKPLKIEAKKEPEGKPSKKDASLKEANLNFSDGVTLNTDGKLRVVKKYDGYYVVGDGMSVPVADREEGYELINELNNPSEKPWKGHEGGELPFVGKNDATAHAVWNKNIGKYEPKVKVAFLAKNPDISLVRKEIKIPVGKSGIGDKFTRVYEFQWETNEIPYLDPFYMFGSSFLEAQSEYKQYFRPYGRNRAGEIVIWQD